MDRTIVRSSNLKSVGYDQSLGTMEIEFNNGGIYQYYSVPIAVYTGLINAPSKGKYFHNNIRSCYQYTRIR